MGRWGLCAYVKVRANRPFVQWHDVACQNIVPNRSWIKLYVNIQVDWSGGPPNKLDSVIRKGSVCHPADHSVHRAGWQAKMVSVEYWMPWRNAHGPHSVCCQWLQLPFGGRCHVLSWLGLPSPWWIGALIFWIAGQENKLLLHHPLRPRSFDPPPPSSPSLHFFFQLRITLWNPLYSRT